MFDAGWGTDDVRLCHRTCTWGGSRSLSESLLVIRRFLDNNPTEVVIIIFEDYVRSPGKLRKILDQADLTRHVLPVKFWGSANHSWPTLTEMKTLGRLVVFSNAAVHGFPYTGVTMWNYVRENRYGNPSRNQKVIMYALHEKTCNGSFAKGSDFIIWLFFIFTVFEL